MGQPARFRRAHTPTMLQMEAAECGAVALGIVLAHHGSHISLEELRVACGVSRDGTKAANLLKAARGYGLEARAFRKEPGDLPALPLPAVVFWNFNHFLVVEGFGRRRVYLNDPAFGPRAVSADEFTASFTGVVLVFEPGPDFKPRRESRGLIRSLARRLKGSGDGLLFAVLASAALALSGLAVPALTQVFVDSYLVGGLTEWLTPLLLGMALAAALRAALAWLQRRCLTRLEMKLAVTGSAAFFHHLLRLPREFFHQRAAGEIGSRVGLNDAVAQLLSGDLAVALLNVLMAGLYAALLALYDPLLAGVCIFAAALNGWALRQLWRGRRDLHLRLLMEKAKLAGAALAGLQSLETLKATGSEDAYYSRWQGHLADVQAAGQRLGRTNLLMAALPPFLTAVCTAAVLSLGGLRVMEGRLTVGMLAAFQGLTAGFLQPVNQLVALGGTLPEVAAELSRIDDVLHCTPDAELGPTRPVLSQVGGPARLQGSLEIRDVAFGYSRLEPPLIEGLSLSVAPGARVALVGASASGKSTVARLICGLYQPWRGQVVFDGRPRRDWPRVVLNGSVALVDQDIVFFAGTVRETLTLWDPTVSEEAVERAVRDACIHDEIAARPGGYESPVEEGAVNFSGGQRQRLEIARALVGDPSLLVLDEATSALDPITEKRIDDNLRRRGCTCVIVAHRLSTIRDCDEILVMEAGRVVQRGTHDALRAVEGAYRRLIEA